MKPITVRKHQVIAACFLCFCSVAFAQTRPPVSMLDPKTDRPDEAWCYLAKSTTVIGLPFQPDVTQVTYDGALFTRAAELCFFYGPHDKPLLARGKTFTEGWIPIIRYHWQEANIFYDIEYFASSLAEREPKIR